MDRSVYLKMQESRDADNVHSEYYVPEFFIGNPIDPNYFCRGWNSKREKYCRARAGQGTDHPGQGRCRNHGGKSLVTHGRYSSVARGSVAEHHEALEIEEESQKMDILPDATMIRALAADYIERYEEFRMGVMRFNEMEAEEAKTEKRKPMYLRAPTLHEASSLLKDAAEVVDKVHRQRAANAIPMNTFFRLMALMADVVNREVKSLEKTLRLKPEQMIHVDKALADISTNWQELKVQKL
jgi:hypothetical protein